MIWNWQRPHWPNFFWNSARLRKAEEHFLVGTSPPSNAAFAMIMLATTPAGDAYTFSELESMFAEAGFVSTEMKQPRHSPERVLISQR